MIPFNIIKLSSKISNLKLPLLISYDNEDSITKFLNDYIRYNGTSEPILFVGDTVSDLEGVANINITGLNNYILSTSNKVSVIIKDFNRHWKEKTITFRDLSSLINPFIVTDNVLFVSKEFDASFTDVLFDHFYITVKDGNVSSFDFVQWSRGKTATREILKLY